MKNVTYILTEQFIKIANKWSTINARPIEVEKDFFVTPSEIHFIDAIWQNKKINVTELSAILGVTKGAVSQMVTILAKKSLILKGCDGINKKTVFLSLTKKGEKVATFHNNLHKSINNKLAEIFGQFSDNEVETSSDMMAQVEKFFDSIL